MAEILATEGVDVTQAAVQASATKCGAVLLHPYSPHYDAAVRDRYIAGKISHEDLKQLFQQSKSS